MPYPQRLKRPAKEFPENERCKNYRHWRRQREYDPQQRTKTFSRFPIVRYNANFRRVKQLSAVTFCYIWKSKNPQRCQCEGAKTLVTFRLAGDIRETKPNAPIRVENRAFCPPIGIEQSSPRLVEYFSSTRCAKEANAARDEMRALPPERFVWWIAIYGDPESRATKGETHRLASCIDSLNNICDAL